MLNKIITFFDLSNGEEIKEKVLEQVKSNISFRGSNLWILACAIVIASVGLNVNSTAVIIGAMLISPLMGPIVGAGFSLGTFDFPLFKKSIKNLIIATVVSLIVSTLYFFLSPFKETQSELLARTSPNIYDVLIAFFGGLVGVIAITRVEKGNPIPGVAIATALMPPLCTAGYGLAIGNFSFFFGAIYLYTINCVFICIATFAIVKYLKYPSSQNFSNKVSENRVKQIIYGLILVMIIPSVFFANQLFQEKKFILKANNFIETEFTQKGLTLIYKHLNSKSNPKSIEVAFLSKKYNSDELNQLKSNLPEYGLNNTNLIIRQDTTDLKKSILNEINKDKSKQNQKDILIANLEKKIKDNNYNNNEILSELKILFPKIKSISIANHHFFENTDSLKIVPIMIYKSVPNLSEDEKTKMQSWLNKRLNKNNLRIIAE